MGTSGKAVGNSAVCDVFALMWLLLDRGGFFQVNPGLAYLKTLVST